jgi:tripartite-type tricarboxylate transporter receptor subunit TctC
MRKSVTLIVLAAGVAALCPAAATAQAYPSKPIRLIVPFPPGGGVDFVGRVVGQRLGERVGQQVVVENRAGANGITGLQVLMSAAPDGYTLANVSAGPMSVNPFIYKSLPYDPLRDFTIIARTNDFPLLLLTHPALPVMNVRDLIALAKSKPGELSYSSAGAGNSDHLAAELFKSLAKINVVHVPYKGSAPSAIALLSGETQMMFNSIPPVLPHVRSGKMRVLGVGSSKRIPSLPEYPTIAEAGLPGYEAYSWGGFIGPAKMPADLVQKLNREIVETVKQKDVGERLLGNGCVPSPASAEDFTALIRSELKKWGDVVKSANIKAD